MLKQLLATDEYDTSAFRLFLGYSGWSVGQLEREMQEESWLVGKAIEKIVFDTGALETWKKAICSLGPEFSFLASMPINPQLN